MIVTKRTSWAKKLAKDSSNEKSVNCSNCRKKLTSEGDGCETSKRLLMRMIFPLLLVGSSVATPRGVPCA